jgi:putative membrane protein
MTAQQFLPAWNSGLNAACTLLLVAAFAAIRAGRVPLHRALMLTAFATSAVFLASYLYYHFAVRNPELTKFTAEGWPRAVYFGVLISHTLLAMVVAVMVPVTLWLGFGAPGNRHKRLARWVLPAWLYVSVTGVVVYVMLYWLFPPAGLAG